MHFPGKHKSLRRRHYEISREWLFWVAALSVLAATDPSAPPLVDFCVWKALGLTACPGCGMGHAIAYILDGRLQAGIDAHPLAPFAAAVIAARLKTIWPKRARADIHTGSCLHRSVFIS